MGTNFYRVRLVTDEDKQHLHELIDQDKLYNQFDENEDNVSNYINTLEETVHICKRSCGWQVAFDHNWGKYYQLTRESITKFLSEPNTQIRDEYGEPITVDEFWKMIDKWNNDPINYRTAENSGSSDFICHGDINKCYITFGITTTNNDFERDGLRFPVYSDFS